MYSALDDKCPRFFFIFFVYEKTHTNNRLYTINVIVCGVRCYFSVEIPWPKHMTPKRASIIIKNEENQSLTHRKIVVFHINTFRQAFFDSQIHIENA